MAKSKTVTLRDRLGAWQAAHPVLADVAVGAGVAIALVGTFVFVTFSGFGASAEFIYNQF
ncbi:MAG: hypothetical protein J6S63_02415 [Atopobiaceae bacterium]|nr:hypothetical protein [Atopobiaceae bacterium]